MILIADSGSTKTHWCISGGREEAKHFYTQGFNPYVQTLDYITTAIRQEFIPQLAGIKKEAITDLYFYGASCSSPQTVKIIQDALKENFGEIRQEVHHDLLAAARALCGKNPGVAAILGTGSNTCHFDGENIIDHIPALGYAMGDEGSGAYLGKRLLQTYLYREMPNDILKSFEQEYSLKRDDILEQIYMKPNPNRYLATFSIFISNHIKHDFIQNLLMNAFRQFFKSHVLKYEDYGNLSFNCCGSVGFHFSDQLKKVAADFGMMTDKIIKSPMDGLIEFHS